MVKNSSMNTEEQLSKPETDAILYSHIILSVCSPDVLS